MQNSPAASLAFLGRTSWLSHLVLLCLPHVLVRADFLILVLLSVPGAGCRQLATAVASRGHGCCTPISPRRFMTLPSEFFQLLIQLVVNIQAANLYLGGAGHVCCSSVC